MVQLIQAVKVLASIQCYSCNVWLVTAECNCINNTQCNVSTGECSCPPLVVGRYCSQCEPNTFGDPTSAYGCTRCTCDELGTALCNSTSGECVCEPFYAGATCDRCSMDAFNDTTAGCQPCQCSVTGSINQSCSSNGQCNCKVASSTHLSLSHKLMLHAHSHWY